MHLYVVEATNPLADPAGRTGTDAPVSETAWASLSPTLISALFSDLAWKQE